MGERISAVINRRIDTMKRIRLSGREHNQSKATVFTPRNVLICECEPKPMHNVSGLGCSGFGVGRSPRHDGLEAHVVKLNSVDVSSALVDI